MVGYAIFLDVVSRVLLVLGIATGLVCVVDWAVRTRRISPFSAVARNFRRFVDPLMKPIEARVVRYGGMPSSAPLWMFLTVIVVGILLLQILGMLGGVIAQVILAATNPSYLPEVIGSWAIRFLSFALIVRVVSTWLPISPYSRWVRWSYVSTEWLLAPLRRVIPQMGPIDITPMAAYLLILVVGRILRLT